MKTTAPADAAVHRLPILQGLLPFDRSQMPHDIIAGITLAALGIPEVMGYTKIAGTPTVTSLYTILLPLVAFALLGASRHLVVVGDSATAAILAGTLTTVAALGTGTTLPRPALSRSSWRSCWCSRASFASAFSPTSCRVAR